MVARPDLEPGRAASGAAADTISDLAISRAINLAAFGVPATSEAQPLAEQIASLPAARRIRPLTRWARFEAWIEGLAHRNRFVRYICSRIWLPIACHSGLVMKKLDPHTFTYVLPFRRFNRNWYHAMAGAALLANSEIAAGMYLFGEMGSRWTVVCKCLSYKFLRPCVGPAIYKVLPLENLSAKLAMGREFNVELALEILQQVRKPGAEHPRVGRCEVVFHCAPKGPEGRRIYRRRRRRFPS